MTRTNTLAHADTIEAEARMAAAFGYLVKIHFSDNVKSWLIGHVVEHTDFEELVSKKMFRFVPISRIEEYDITLNINLSRLHRFDCIAKIQKV